MPLYRREGTPFWWYSFTVNGVRFRGSTGQTEKKAAKVIEDDEKHRARKAAPASGNWQLRQIFGTYWNEVGKHKASHRVIEMQLDYLSEFLGPNTRVAKLDAPMLIDYRARRRGTAPKGRQVREHTVNRDFATLRAALNYCNVIYGQPLPAINWKKLKATEPPGRIRFLSREEWSRLYLVANPSVRPIIICAMTTGLRKGNILRLDWQQVKLDEKLIQTRIKGNKRHGVRIAPALMAVLSTMPHRKGKVFDTTNFRKRWDAARKDAELEDFRFHDLRHTFASWARRGGADLADICEALNHSSVSMTMRYAHIKPEEHRTAFDRVSDDVLAQFASQSVQEAQK